MQLPIYFDYMATTPVDPRVAKKMQECLTSEGCFGNPASQTHKYGWDAAKLAQQAREQVAQAINADPQSIIWTSGATEADNLALKGAALFYQRKGKHIVTMSTEHKAVLDVCKYLESIGFEVTYLNPEANGLLDVNKFAAALRPDTILVSIMQVNNETGVIQDIAKLTAITRDKGILFHTDATQALGKELVDVEKLNVDLLSCSAHKVYGPKGIGALYVRQQPRVRLEPLIHGGGHERGLRSGTLATHQVVGMGEAFHIAQAEFSKNREHILNLRNRLWEGIKNIPGLHLHGDLKHMTVSCLNISFDGIKGDSLLLALRDLAVSSGSACTSSNPQPSHVLLAMGVSPAQANVALRISLGRCNTEEEIDFAIQKINQKVAELRG